VGRFCERKSLPIKGILPVDHCRLSKGYCMGGSGCGTGLRP
jgi:hypothetical protein